MNLLDAFPAPILQKVMQNNPLLQQQPQQDIVGQAISQYPILQNLNIHGVTSLGQQPYKLEFWQPNDQGSQDYQRPKNIPLDAIGIQIFDKSVTPKDVLADVTSHYLVNNDKTISNLYNKFKKSITKQQQNRLFQDYQYAIANENEQRPYSQWLEQTRLPAYFRGYTFSQWPESFNKQVFTKDQFKIFDKVRKYLGVIK